MSICSKCPVCNENRQKVDFDGSCEESGIYIVGQNPGAREVEQGKPFVGRSGTLLSTMLHAAGIDRKTVRIGNIVKCFFPPGTEIKKDIVNVCKQYVLDDIKKHEPKVIITLGERAYFGITGKDNFSSHRFVPTPYPELGCWIVPLYHPRFLMENRSLGLKHMMIKMMKHAKYLTTVPVPQVDRPEVEILTNFDDIVKAIRYFRNQKFAAFDFETSSLYSHFDISYIATCAISDGKRTVAFPVENYFNEKQTKQIISEFIEFIHDNNVSKLVFNMSFENYWILSRMNTSFERNDNFHDVMLLSYMIYPRDGLFGLKELSRVWLGADETYAIDVKDVYSMLKENPESIYDLMIYNGIDAYYTYHIFDRIANFVKEMRQALRKNNLDFEYRFGFTAEEISNIIKLLKYYKISFKYLPITVSKTQFNGCIPNIEFIDDLELRLKNELHKELEKIYSDERVPESTKNVIKSFGVECGEKLARILGFEKENVSKEEKSIKKMIFDIRSSKQLAEFFIKNGYELPKTSKGNYSVNESVLKNLAEKDKFAKRILTVRGIDKKLSAYVNTFRKWIFPDGKFHPSYRIVSEGTARPLANKINIQQFPKRKGKEMRQVLKAPEGYIILDFDYSALEVRVLAMLSRDQKLVEYILNGIDFHLEWSKRIFGEKLAKENRNLVKNQFVFPLFYGAGVKTVSNGLGIPEDKAVKLIDEFWNEFSGVKLWQEKMFAEYNRNGCVSNYFGRRRYAPVSWNVIVNYPIQSTGVEFTIYAWNKLVEKGYWVAAEIHDELVVYVKDDEKSIRQGIRDIYEAMVKQPWKILEVVPLSIEGKIGYDWYNMKEINLEEYLS